MMDRKSFLKHGALGALGLSSLLTSQAKSEQYRSIRSLRPIGFNHLPNNEIRSMKSILHRAYSRGHANHGWLDSHHSFSFANYYNPERMHFGVLRVLNDDRVAPGKGFGTHPHENMEIISIPLEGDLEHQDSMGNKALIKEGDVQVMSAGTGIYHSEYNASKDAEVKFLQIWMFPKQKNVEPRYDQITLQSNKMDNRFYQILSPQSSDDGVWAHQDSWFSMGNFSSGYSEKYKLKRKGNGVYVFVLEGKLKVGEHKLEKRDGLGLWDTEIVSFDFVENSKVLLMEVPMELPNS